MVMKVNFSFFRCIYIFIFNIIAIQWYKIKKDTCIEYFSRFVGKANFLIYLETISINTSFNNNKQ